MLASDRAPGKARIALDRKSVRTVDRDGRLHIALSNISKATVDPYYGREIPDGDRLGLDPDKIYYLLRDPEELAKAAPTFNNLPILNEHIPVNAEAPQKEAIIGSTGTDADFNSPYLQNSAVVWCQDDIDDIESARKKEWSCAYYYTADMTPGEFNGLRYDGIMRNIVGNHVALVDQGRAGPDVVVGDKLPEGMKMAKSRRALLLHGAVAALIAPKLAQDATLQIAGAFASATAKTRGKDADKIAADVVKLVGGKLAQDEGLDVSDVVSIIKAVDGTEETAPAVDEDEIDDDQTAATITADGEDDAIARIMAFIDGKLSDEDMAELGNIVSGGGAVDEEPEDQPGNPPQDKEKDKPAAMDAAAIRRATLREAAEIRDAEHAVEPFIGRLKVAQDSAAAVYKLALDHAGVDLKGVPKAAYKAMVAMLPKPGATPAATTIAQDRAASRDGFSSRFPDAHKLRA